MDNVTNEHIEPRWHSRGILPHFEGGSIPQSVTFRLADSLPQQKLKELNEELRRLSCQDADLERRKKIESWLDAGIGDAWLKQPAIAEIVQKALLFFDGTRYELHAWVIMPTHVHVLFTPLGKWTLSKLLQSWKSYSAHAVNRHLQQTGRFWSEEYFDRAIRDEHHHAALVQYIEANPVKAGLCDKPKDWKFGSAFLGHPESADILPPGKADILPPGKADILSAFQAGVSLE
ncbi:MAG: transposase [Desulfuromonadaceae bacterium]|nr:transposase [Desulfuromonadaceae bacterium]